MNAEREARISVLRVAGWDEVATQFGHAYDWAQEVGHPRVLVLELDELLDDATSLCESNLWINDVEVFEDLRFAISEVVQRALFARSAVDDDTATLDVEWAAFHRSATAVAAVHAQGSDAFDVAWMGTALVSAIAAGTVIAQISGFLAFVAFIAAAVAVYRAAGALEHSRVQRVSRHLIEGARSLERDARQYAIEAKLAGGRSRSERKRLEWRAGRISDEASAHQHAASLLECSSSDGGGCLCREWRTKYGTLNRSSFAPGAHRCTQCARRMDARD